MTSGSPASRGHSDSPFIVGLAGFIAVIVSSGLAVDRSGRPLGGLGCLVYGRPPDVRNTKSSASRRPAANS
jgi:hypothetical protein